MKRVYGNTTGLKANQVRRLTNLYRRRSDPEYLLSPELTKEISALSGEIRRQIGLLIDRAGRVTHVLAGDRHSILIPSLDEYRLYPGRLRGLRCIHTHLAPGPLSQDDLADLRLLRLDVMAAVTVAADGRPDAIHVGHLLPPDPSGPALQLMPPLGVHGLDIGIAGLIRALEDEMALSGTLRKADSGSERAILVSVFTGPRRYARERLAELADLATSGRIDVIDTVYQQRRTADARHLLGQGKLNTLTIDALEKGATLLIFDQELNPSQLRTITDRVALKVIDRTQLILDIFAQRAQSREGKLQVELAQLKYLLPRLVVKNTAMSRLTGGIGGRGPGETKLEINRRRARTRIKQLETAVTAVSRQRRQQKARRTKRDVPVISIVGYTNAGKSTLLNALTQSRVLVENRLFATLDPSSRRLRFPADREVIITDTVGFIHDLPKDLMAAFRATLEELASADLLLHVIDVSNPRYEQQMASVARILEELELHGIPCLRVLNKSDRLAADVLNERVNSCGDGIAISALDRTSLRPLTEVMADRVLG